MDALANGPQSVTEAATVPFLPAEVPTAMPEQSLRGPQPKAPPIVVRPRALLLRRAFILFITLALTARACHHALRSKNRDSTGLKVMLSEG